jgi:hypothetical protein
MKELKENLKVNQVDNLQSIVKTSGEKLGWRAISISDNQIEFQYTKHLTKFNTIVSWTNDGNINLTSNYMKKSVKADLGSYRKNHNETIKLSILREIDIYNINAKSVEDGLNDLLIKNKKVESFEKDKINKTQKASAYTKQISDKNNAQNKSLTRIAIVGAILLIPFLFIIFFTEDIRPCDCID